MGLCGYKNYFFGSVGILTIYTKYTYYLFGHFVLMQQVLTINKTGIGSKQNLRNNPDTKWRFSGRVLEVLKNPISLAILH